MKKITPKWWFWLILIKFWWIQIRISQQLQGIRIIVDQFHDPWVILYRSGSSVYYKIWPLQIWIFDRYCIFEFEFWPLKISNFKFFLINFYFWCIFYTTPKYYVLTINFEWATLFWIQPLLLGVLIDTPVV